MPRLLQLAKKLVAQGSKPVQPIVYAQESGPITETHFIPGKYRNMLDTPLEVEEPKPKQVSLKRLGPMKPRIQESEVVENKGRGRKLAVFTKNMDAILDQRLFYRGMKCHLWRITHMALSANEEQVNVYWTLYDESVDKKDPLWKELQELMNMHEKHVQKAFLTFYFNTRRTPSTYHIPRVTFVRDREYEKQRELDLAFAKIEQSQKPQ
ncbi:hypothetical protein EDD86DRAFT_206828 [Gorgonomyces haynaldii]|nr:hypothetical protein EDD86DRAFT_206828 [Gorgonomyces haynaldii]